MKKTFVFYSDWIDYTQEMTLEEKGLFLQTILNYKNGQELGDIEKIKFVWSRVKKQIDEDKIKRDEEVEKRKASGKLGGLASASKRKQVLPIASKFKQLQADNENDNDNVKKREEEKTPPRIVNNRTREFLLNESNKKRKSYPIIKAMYNLGYAPPNGETEDEFLTWLASALGERTQGFMDLLPKRMMEFETYWKEQPKEGKKKPNWKSKLLYNFNNFE